MEFWESKMEGMEVVNKNFWRGKKVFLTGHTGFKGSWLSLWLQELGVDLTGFSLPPPTTPNLFEITGVSKNMHSIIGDICHQSIFTKALIESKPEIIIHMAAQPLVRTSYKNPIETFSTNIMGVIHLLEGVRQLPSCPVVLNVTSDKCYENVQQQHFKYRENHAMGGSDPYSCSKACSELITHSYRHSFFNLSSYYKHGVAIASARAGNVIGGGDWAEDRLIPDIMRGFTSGKMVKIRYPYATRPWQHVLEPIAGYLTLIEKLYYHASEFSGAWNFGPNEEDIRPVSWVVESLASMWSTPIKWEYDKNTHPHEEKFLMLDCQKAKAKLGWFSKWNLQDGLRKIVDWYESYISGENMSVITRKQIQEFSGSKLKV